MLRTLVSAGLGIAIAATPAWAQQMLDGNAIRTLLVGKSALFADYSVSEYRPDGHYTHVAANNRLFHGQYTIDGDKLCLALDGEGGFCALVGKDSKGLFMLADGGAPFRFSTASGIMPQNTATFCGVPVAYSLTTPPADVPAKARGFAGVWTGEWNDGLCTALVVERVQPDGRAELLYVHGSRKGALPLAAGTLRLAGRISDGKLNNGGPASRMEYVLTNDRLLGSYSMPGASGRGTFRRQ